MKLCVTLIFLDLQLLTKMGTDGAERLRFTLALTAGADKTENGFNLFDFLNY